MFYPAERSHEQNFAYLIIDALKRHVTVLYHKFGSPVSRGWVRALSTFDISKCQPLIASCLWTEVMVQFFSAFNPLMGTGNYSAHRIIWSWYTGRWWVGCYIWYSEEGTGRAGAPPSPLLAVPNVTTHPSTASVPTSYYSMCTIIPCAH